MALAATLALVALVFLPALRCGFTSWDDDAFCSANPDVAHPNLLRIFDPSNWVVGDWTPLATVTYAAERALLGPAPWVPHATNVALHVLAVGLAYRLLRELGFTAWTSLGAALVFGVHPLQAESVVWVSARKNVLVEVFALAFLRSYLAGRHGRASVWFVLALCSKATAVGLPLAAAAMHLLGLGAARPRWTWGFVAGWLGLSAARAALSLKAQAVMVATLASYGLSGRMAYMGSVLTTQARQVVAPAGLSVVYDPPRRGWDDPVLLAQWAGIAALVAAAVLLARRDRKLAFLGVFAALMFAPTANVFPGVCLQADRYLHLPLLAIGAFALAALRPLATLRAWLPGAALAAWCAAVLVPATIARESAWRTSETLWNDACLRTPGSGLAWGNLGAELLAQGRTADATAALERAVALPHPQLHTARFDLALARYRGGDAPAAEPLLREVLAVRPDDGRAHALLGRICTESGRLDEAAPHLDEAAGRAPDWTTTWLARAELAVRRGRLDGARAEIARARELPEDAAAVATAAAAVEFLDGKADAALALLRAAAPSASEATLREVLARKLRHLGRPDDAARAAGSR